jgi:hypothetical protein
MYWCAIIKVVIAIAWRFLGREDIQLQFPAALTSGKLIPLPLWMAGYIKCTLKNFMIRTVHKMLFFYRVATAPPPHPRGPGPPYYRSITITLRHTALGRTSSDQWSARCRDLYLKTHNSHKRKISMHPARFEPVIPASERPRTDALDRAATGIGSRNIIRIIKKRKTRWAYVWVRVRCEYIQRFDEVRERKKERKNLKDSCVDGRMY